MLFADMIHFVALLRIANPIYFEIPPIDITMNLMRKKESSKPPELFLYRPSAFLSRRELKVTPTSSTSLKRINLHL